MKPSTAQIQVKDLNHYGIIAAITITHGYSRDHRPDLKQFIIDLMCTGDGDIPMYLRVADGNESDRAIFAQLIREFNQEWDIDALFVADAALAGCGSSQVASSDALSLRLCVQKISNR